MGAARRTGRPRTAVSGAGSVRAKVALAVTAAASVLVACGSSDEPRDEAVVEGGQELYEAHCIGCHGGAVGGGISDIPPPHNAEGHTWHHADCLIVETVLERMDRPGYPEMPAFAGRLNEEDVRAILAYVETWWTDEQREFQDEMTEQECR